MARDKTKAYPVPFRTEAVRLSSPADRTTGDAARKTGMITH